MSAVVMMLLGGGLGVGVIAVTRSLQPRPAPILEVFAATEVRGAAYGEVNSSQDTNLRGLLVSMGRRLATFLADDATLRRDLAVSGSSLDEHALNKAAWPAGVILSGWMIWSLSRVIGLRVGGLWALVAILGLAGVAFVLPDIRLRGRAQRRRSSFRHALSAYLDLVSMIMAGGGGLVTALQVAADSGDGWVFAELRAALDRARLSNRSPWSQLRLLADDFDIAELRDLTTAAELAGSEGARMIASVETRSDVLRSRIQSEIETTAESLTEQMLLPVGLLLVALFLFIGFAIFSQLGAGPPSSVLQFVDGLQMLRSFAA